MMATLEKLVFSSTKTNPTPMTQSQLRDALETYHASGNFPLAVKYGDEREYRFIKLTPDENVTARCRLVLTEEYSTIADLMNALAYYIARQQLYGVDAVLVLPNGTEVLAPVPVIKTDKYGQRLAVFVVANNFIPGAAQP
jgi:hypothetical protein